MRAPRTRPSRRLHPHRRSLIAPTRSADGRGWTQKVTAIAALIGAIGAAGVALWVGKTTADVADQTRRDTLVAQHAQQFITATGQLAAGAVEVQLGGIVSLGQLAESDGDYVIRVCPLLRAYTAVRLPKRPDYGVAKDPAPPSRAAIAALDVLGGPCAGQPGLTFTNSFLKGADMPAARLAQLTLTRADLTGADLTGADLTGAKLNGANLTWAKLNGANLTWAKLNGANLTTAYLTWAKLNGAYLTWAKLNGADLTGAKLNGADLTGADLTTADLNGADLSRADLTTADLTGAKLNGANLTTADLTGANLTTADLTGAKLNGAKLTRANLTGADLTRIQYDDQTTWPHAFTPPPSR